MDHRYKQIESTLIFDTAGVIKIFSVKFFDKMAEYTKRSHSIYKKIIQYNHNKSFELIQLLIYTVQQVVDK